MVNGCAGSMYFFKDDSYYLFNGNRLDIETGYPRLINFQWQFCSENLEQYASTAVAAVAHSSLYGVYVTLLIVFLYYRLIVRLH